MKLALHNFVRSRMVTTALIVTGVMLVTEAAVGVADLDCAVSELPARLSDTGLYFDIASKRIACDVLPYEPQYPLWTDGAAKKRWIRLPSTTTIDASDPDHFVFPVGTRLWKEFSFGTRVETRFMLLGADEKWRFGTYLWSVDQRDAVLAPAEGVRAACESGPGVAHDVPARADCTACHADGADAVLGFDALQLSSDRDPLASHAQVPAADGVDLARLVRSGRVRNLPQRFVDTPPRIAASSPRERAVLGYLDANCGMCHTQRAPIPGLDLDLSYSLTRAGPPAAIATAVERASRFRFPGDAELQRIAPGAPDQSVLVRRMSARQPLSQMPPLGTHAVDADALALVRDWIREDLVPTQSVATNSSSHDTRN
ncbi:MAG TPA: hypothetical protein VGR31_09225 [Planctomycetota bacterium]|jgi:mono/diheme cytochrome c family protein|nr:hypothetical protein [Planctomycetota bacterium]